MWRRCWRRVPGLALLGGWSARGETLAAMLSQEEAKLGYLFYVVCALVTVNVCNMLLPLVGACCLRAMGVARVYTPKDFQLNTIMMDIVALVEPGAAAA